MPMDVELVHRALMEDAARVANDLIQAESDLIRLLPENKNQYPTGGRFDPKTRKKRYAVAGQFYRPDPGRTGRGGITLSLDESVKYLPPETIERIHWIANQGIRAAIKMNPDKIGYLIVADAFDGVNYFDRFADAHQQLSFL
jgi:hypothetical protein